MAQMIFNLPDTIQINAGKDIKLDVSVAQLIPHADVNAFIYHYGLKQVLADSHSGMTKEKEPDKYKELSRSLAEKKLKALYDGDVSVIGDRSRYEPVEREARRMAMIDIQNELRAKGKKLNTIKSDKMAALIEDNWQAYKERAAQYLRSAQNKPKINLKAVGL
jgi:hypothetical protein